MLYLYVPANNSRYIGVLTLLSVNTTPHERPAYIGLTGLTWGLGTVLGPVSPDSHLIYHVFLLSIILTLLLL